MANSFTPQQIEDFLQEFFDVVGARQYIGARYVPIFGRRGEDTVEWDDGAPYEPLTVVMHLGVSYVSRQYVPTGTPITDTDFWVETYRFNAQVEQYRQEVLGFQGQIDQIREDMESDYVPFPDPDTYPKYGTTGQVLTTLTDGKTKWEDPVVVDADIAEPLISEWLDTHPEATTTVEDGSITYYKLNDTLKPAVRNFQLETGTDLNTLYSSGAYRLALHDTYPNDPVGAEKRRMVLVYPTDSGSTTHCYQFAFDMTGGRLYTRVYAGNAWSSWASYAIPADSSVTYAKLDPDLRQTVKNYSLTDNTDLDTVTNSGLYRLTLGVEYPNSPASGSYRRLLIAYAAGDSSASHIYQMLITPVNGRLYTRVYVGNAWSSWAVSDAPADGTVAYASLDANLKHSIRNSELETGTDLNTLYSSGAYRLALHDTYPNDPVGAEKRRMVLVYPTDSGSTTHCYQFAFDMTGGRLYTRVYAGNAWSSWASYDSQAESLYTPQTLDTHTHVVAHRGVPHYAPAGTKPSYVLAKQMGLLIAEADIRFTSDDVAVVFHDATYTVDGVTHTVADETYAQFMTYDIGAAFSSDFTGTYGLTLSQFLQLCDNLQLIPAIEFKTGTQTQIASCLNLIKSRRSNVFNYKASVATLKQIIDEFPTASVRLGADDYSTTLYDNLVEILNYGEKRHTTHCIFSAYGNWSSSDIATCRAAGAIMGVSSINTNTQLRALTEDVDIIFTEYGFNSTRYLTLNEMVS